MAKLKNDKKEEVNPATRKYALTLFLFLLPLLIIAFTTEFVTKILLFFYEGVLLANFVKDKMHADVI